MPKTEINQIYNSLWYKIEEFDKRYSRFRLDSELTSFNQRPGVWNQTSEEFSELLTAAIGMSESTSGTFNPFILPALNRVGYKSSWVPTDATANPPDYSDRMVVTPNSLKLKTRLAKIPVNSAIDMGGIGKGFLLDKLAASAEELGIYNYWFSLGGDIIARGHDKRDNPWQIMIASANNPNNSIASVNVPTDRSIAIATSGITKRRGRHAGKDWHHIIDPVSGESAKTDILTATVVVSDATQADVYASCLVSLGSEQADNFARTHNITDYLLQIGSKSANKTRLVGDKIKLL